MQKREVEVKNLREQKQRIVLRVIATIFTLAYVCWIFSNSLKDANASSVSSGKVRAAVQRIADGLFGEGRIFVSAHFIRKTAHFSEFALLGFLAYFTYFTYFLHRLKAEGICVSLSAATTLICGAADECLQIFVDGRGPSVFDVMIDFSGGVFGVFVALAVFFSVKSLQKHSKNRKNARKN